MSGEQVREELRNLDPETFASKYIFESVPHVFADDMDSYVLWKAALGEQIDVDPRAIAITGSAGVGISLNPEKSLRDFGAKSDIDVAVVSFHHFDLAWRCLRAMPSALRLSLSRRQRESAKDHERRLIYWGTIATDRILEVLPFSTPWLKALSDMAGIDPTADRNINARIYRDFESLRAYQLRSVEKVRSNLEAGGTDEP
jgi:hypothetical protein